jgi:Zn-dependent M32 family carboxypeptidase
MFTGDESKRQIENIKNLDRQNPPEAAPLRRELEILERDRNRAITLPIELVERFSKLTNLAHGIWADAKKK